MIIKIEKSPVKYKRYRVYMDTGKHYDFGLLGGETYIDHKDANKRRNYWLRHYGNPTEKILIDNLVPSPSLFSAYLLWGVHSNLEKNIKELNELWKFKHKKQL
jgi:hypothetical protein